MSFDFFDFDGQLIEDLFRLLDKKLKILESAIDRNHPEDFGGHEIIEHIHGVAAVVAQRFVSITCDSFGVKKETALKLGPLAGGVPKIGAIYAAANFWKHADEPVSQLHKNTRSTLIDVGIDLDSSSCEETSYLVGNVIRRCGYSNLKEIIMDLRTWTDLVIEESNSNTSKE